MWVHTTCIELPRAAGDAGANQPIWSTARRRTFGLTGVLQLCIDNLDALILGLCSLCLSVLRLNAPRLICLLLQQLVCCARRSVTRLLTALPRRA